MAPMCDACGRAATPVESRRWKCLNPDCWMYGETVELDRFPLLATAWPLANGGMKLSFEDREAIILSAPEVEAIVDAERTGLTQIVSSRTRDGFGRLVEAGTP